MLAGKEASMDDSATDEVASADVVPSPADPAYIASGDLWSFGRHHLLCGDDRNSADYKGLEHWNT
jgi:hypothetical protein